MPTLDFDAALVAELQSHELLGSTVRDLRVDRPARRVRFKRDGKPVTFQEDGVGGWESFFDPDQPRDESGQWSGDGGGGSRSGRESQTGGGSAAGTGRLGSSAAGRESWKKWAKGVAKIDLDDDAADVVAMASAKTLDALNTAAARSAVKAWIAEVKPAYGARLKAARVFQTKAEVAVEGFYRPRYRAVAQELMP